MHPRPLGRSLIRTLTVLACALALPSTALASTGGGSGGGGLTDEGPTGTAAPTSVPTSPAAEPVSASSDGITLQTTSSALLRHQLSFTGSAPGDAGQTIEIEREGRATNGEWESTVSTTVASDGTFAATWHTSQVGRFSMRAVTTSDTSTPESASATAAPSALTVSVYRDEKATVYGPGFYGRKTACGSRLNRSTLGVANRTLPCGTEVSLMYGGRELTVPVIDRGPYANGASWDVTMATASALGMNGTEWIGSISLPAGEQTASALAAPSLALR
ncbi:MAG TPA: septal ring lytic transglycosylase RlpA family protein [Solirubrobacteraceae bacterium]|nr:septal ring lytic transglycosylase RlpA family protein [Solirubrobacteraceae bacterium]